MVLPVAPCTSYVFVATSDLVLPPLVVFGESCAVVSHFIGDYFLLSGPPLELMHGAVLACAMLFSGTLKSFFTGSIACVGESMVLFVVSVVVFAKNSDNLCGASICLSPMLKNGTEGADFFNAWINSLAAAVALYV